MNFLGPYKVRDECQKHYVERLNGQFMEEVNEFK